MTRASSTSSQLLLVVVVGAVLGASAARASPCTLKKPVKVGIALAGTLSWRPVAAGVTIEVKTRGPKWSEVSTPLGAGKVATASLDCDVPIEPLAAPPAPPPPPAPALTAPIVLPAMPSVAAAQAAAKKGRRIAVYKLDAAGIDDRINRVITDSVVSEMRKLDKTTVVGMDEIKAMLDLEAQKQLNGCSDVSCVAEIAEALGVDGVVIGNIAVVGGGLVFGLKHIDQHTATTLGQATRRIESTDPADVLAAVGPEVQELFPDVPLKPGATRGVPPEVALRIHPPPLSPAVFWTLAAGSGLAVATGAAFTTWNALAYASAQKRAATGATTVIDGGDLNGDIGGVRTAFAGLVVAYSAGAAIAAGAGVSALFVDWRGAGDAE